MKRIVAVPALLLVLACQDHTPLQPEPELAPSPALAQAPNGLGDGAKMVPLKMAGTWWPTAEGDPSPCEEFADAVPLFLEWEGTSTHMGRMGGSATNCMGPGAYGSRPFLSHSTTMMAANGDLLYSHGSAAGDGTQMVIHPDLSFAIVSAPLVGGTGRFRDATGSYNLYGDNIAGGAFTLEGWISSVGSSR